MARVDIRKIKTQMRTAIKEHRRAMSAHQKQDYDRTILDKLIHIPAYQNAQLVLTYVSLPIEVDTMALIYHALEAGKQVAVPKCLPQTHQMQFYYITSLEDLEPATFNVLEPIVDKCQMVEDFSRSVCIVPALAYDFAGYRLGYGAGYYDRFLSGYSGFTVGVVYSANVRRKLMHGHFDVPVQLIITEKYLRRVHSQNTKNKAKAIRKG